MDKAKAANAPVRPPPNHVTNRGSHQHVSIHPVEGDNAPCLLRPVVFLAQSTNKKSYTATHKQLLGLSYTQLIGQKQAAD